MKKIIYISTLCATFLFSNEVVLEKVSIKGAEDSQIVENLSVDHERSSNLADALSKKTPSIFVVKRSGISNDIILRGQKKDNINVLMDNAKIYGACGGRMDPPISHIATNNIKSIKIIEGPYDVENFGTLSGLVQVKTKDPEEGFDASIDLNAGSFGYKKASTIISGGSESLKLLLSASIQESDQYKDGDGNNFLEQQIKQGVPFANQYRQNDLKAFEKYSILSKGIYNFNSDNEISFGYSANRNKDILYPMVGSDAYSDDSDIFTMNYESLNLGEFSKKLELEYYYSQVDHPMGNKYRNSGTNKFFTSHPKTSIWGAKIINEFEAFNTNITLGIDTSNRVWEGNRYVTNVATGITTQTGVIISKTDTKNNAIFTKLNKDFGRLNLEFGARYDDTKIDNVTRKDNKYESLNANIYGVYTLSDKVELFAGIGKSSRVPDARELYTSIGNENLKQTKNYEIDLGFEQNIGNFFIKTKIFYSQLKDFIYNFGGNTSNSFQNINANIYGIDFSGLYYANENIYFDYGLAYQRGKKDGNFEDKNLAEIPPLKFTASFNYENDISKFTAQVVAVDRWSKFDASANEQELAGYAVFNLKYNHNLGNGFDITLGADNIFNKTYASTNTYQDIGYILVEGSPVLFNEAGRYLYANLRYQF